jgi:Ca2+-binding EF-hand superfamily protein
MHPIFRAFAVLVLFAALPAFAEEPRKPGDPRVAFAETDENADGHVDREEFHHRMVEIFFHGDRDKDGHMTPDELAAAVEFPKDFDGADRNADGRISLYEFIQVRFATFDEVDTDHDGLLSVEEVIEAYQVRD